MCFLNSKCKEGATCATEQSIRGRLAVLRHAFLLFGVPFRRFNICLLKEFAERDPNNIGLIEKSNLVTIEMNSTQRVGICIEPSGPGQFQAQRALPAGTSTLYPTISTDDPMDVDFVCGRSPTSSPASATSTALALISQTSQEVVPYHEVAGALPVTKTETKLCAFQSGAKELLTTFSLDSWSLTNESTFTPVLKKIAVLDAEINALGAANCMDTVGKGNRGIANVKKFLSR